LEKLSSIVDSTFLTNPQKFCGLYSNWWYIAGSNELFPDAGRLDPYHSRVEFQRQLDTAAIRQLMMDF
jgi:hypothetical protein